MNKPIVLVVAAIALVAAACTRGGEPSSGGAGGSITEGGELRIAAFDGIDSLNPFVGVNDDSYSTYEYIYPQLVQYDRNVDFTPDLATSWDSSSDGRTWTFHLHPDVKWSDGRPLTAADVAWTFNTIVEYKHTVTAGSAGAVAHLTSVSAKDPATVALHYDAAVPAVLANVQQVSILPEHVWAKYATGDGTALKRYANTPTKDLPVVSGGPFMVTQYQQDAVTLFQRNPNYYGTAPHIDGFGLQYFSNEDAEVTAIKNGEIDVIENVPATSVQTLRAADLNVYEGPGLTYRTFIINSSPYKRDHPELQNPQVRQAFEYAIDRQRIVDTAWLGHAQPGTTIVPPSTGKWHDDSIHPLPFDLAKANQILDGLGFAKGPDGIRVANGHPMTYDVLFPASERGAGDRAFQVIQADFAQIGVKLVQRPVTGAYAIMTAPNNRYENWDLAMWNWTPPVDPDFILFAMTCASLGDWSDSGYCNKDYDKLYLKQQTTVDAQTRLQIVDELQRTVYDDRPYIVLVYNDTLDAWSRHWAGFVQSSQGLFASLTKASLISVHQV
jgi:peptide/nickel transport system substrate-binding protein